MGEVSLVTRPYGGRESMAWENTHLAYNYNDLTILETFARGVTTTALQSCHGNFENGGGHVTPSQMFSGQD